MICVETFDRESDKIKEIENFLKGYALHRKLLQLDRYERQFMGGGADEELLSETAFARPRMYEVRRFIMSLDNSDEKLLLYYHYIKGESVERCSELLGISRSSGFRLKRRALVKALNKALEDKIIC